MIQNEIIYFIRFNFPQSFYSLCQLFIYYLSAPNSPSLPCFVILALDPAAGYVFPVRWFDVKLANREVGDCKAEAGRRNFSSFLTMCGFSVQEEQVGRWGSKQQSPCQWLPSVQCPQAKILHHLTGGCSCIHQQGTLWQWAACPLFRGLNLCLVEISSNFLSSSVFTPSAWGEGAEFSAVATSIHLRVFFHPFISQPPFTQLTIIYLNFSLFKLLLTRFWLIQSAPKTK